MSTAAVPTDPGNSVEVLFDDGRSIDHEAVQRIKQQWVNDAMKSREADYVSSSPLSVFCGTFNVAAKKPEDVDLRDWLLPGSIDPSTQPADLYVVGFQEIVDLNAMNVAIDTQSTKRADFWQGKISSCLLTTRTRYQHVISRHLVGILVCIFVREDFLPHIRDVRAITARVGVMGMMGNKGGVSIRMNIFDSSFCFVCSHLAAHRENVKGRNDDVKNIIEKSTFDGDSRISLGWEASNRQTNRPLYGDLLVDDWRIEILAHDKIFWLGDLNYRIDESVSTEEVFSRVAARDLLFLRSMDQLNIERPKGTVFQGFNEGELSFLPTYKIQTGTQNYEARPEKKLRAPAWCDRILWRVNKGNIKQLYYRRAEVYCSDHLPVCSLFSCDVRVVDLAKERCLYNDIMKKVDIRDQGRPPTPVVEGAKF